MEVHSRTCNVNHLRSINEIKPDNNDVYFHNHLVRHIEKYEMHQENSQIVPTLRLRQDPNVKPGINVAMQNVTPILNIMKIPPRFGKDDVTDMTISN